MAKKKKIDKIKYFDCPTCTEKTYFQADMICSLRVQSLDDMGVPSSYSLCEHIKICNYYRKVTTSNI